MAHMRRMILWAVAVGVASFLANQVGADWPHAERLQAIPAELRDPTGVVYQRTDKPNITGQADVLYFLHTFQPGPAVTDWLARNREVKRLGERPLEPPTVFHYVIRYRQGEPVTVNARWDEAVNAWVRNGEFAPPAFATVAWQQTINADWVQDVFPRRGQHVVLYSFRFENPRPEQPIAGVEVVPLPEWGTPLVLAMAAGRREAVGRTYYVAPDGNDEQPGTFAQPWATMYKAAATLQAGDTVYVRGGRYKLRSDWQQIVAVQNSGAAGRPITFAGYPGETAVLDGDDHHCAHDTRVPYAIYDRDQGLFNIFEKTNIVVRSLWIENSRKSGLGVYQSRDIWLDHNTVFGAYHCGMNTARTTQFRIIGNTLGRNCSTKYAFDLKTQAWQPHAGKPPGREAIDNHGNEHVEIAFNEIYHCDKDSIADPGRHFRIHHNEIHDCWSEYPMAGNLYLDAYGAIMDDLDVHDNIIYRVTVGICVGSEGGARATNIRIHRNLCFSNYFAGIILNSAGNNGPRDNIIIENNTIHGNGWREGNANPGGGIHLGTHEARDIVIRHNLVTGNRDYAIATVGQDRVARRIEIYGNLCEPVFPNPQRLAAKFPHWTPVLGDLPVVGEPRYINAAEADFRLQPDSPAIDVIATRTDPDGTAGELGAFDFVQRLPPLPPAGAGYVLRLNCGANQNYTDRQGRLWQADKGVLRKGDGGAVRRSPRPIAQTDVPEIYLTEWYGMPRFELAVTPGRYRLRLHFAETHNSAPGQRIFSVMVNRLPLVEHFDPARDGINTAVVVERAVVASLGKIVVEFIKETGQPLINALELIQETAP